MFSAGIFISGRDWIWVAAVITGLALVILFWGYRAGREAGIYRWICPVLKVLGFAALLFCLLEPLWSGQRARPGANLMAIVADNSQGLQIKDAGADRTRGEMMMANLQDASEGWQK